MFHQQNSQVDLVNLFHPPDECKELYNAGKDPSKLRTEMMGLQFCYFGNIEYAGCGKDKKIFMNRNVDGFPVGTEYPPGNSLPDRNNCLKLFPDTIDPEDEKGAEYVLLQRFPEPPTSLAR